MANKYYYNGKLVRTSDHIYTHAVLNEKGEVIACRPSFDKASSVIISEVSRAKRTINDNNKGIEARKAGKDGYWSKDGNRKYFVSFRTFDNLTVDEFTRQNALLEKAIEEYSKYSVVELERI